MPSAAIIVNLLSVLLIPSVFGETEIRFAGQIEFVVNETSTTVIRLVIERIGEPANVTAIVSLYGEDTGDFFDTFAAAFIPAGETNRTVYIAVCDDDFPEPDETFTFYLTVQKPSANVKLGWPRTITVTVLSNDNAFGIISFNMVVSGPNPPEEDLSPVRGNITFPPGKATVVYNLTVLDDEVSENDEIFLIQLIIVEGGAEINTTRNSVEIIIKKNDSPVRFIQNAYLIPEEDQILIISVLRGKDDMDNMIGSDEDEVCIDYAVITGNSTAHSQQDVDFIDLQSNTTITFPPFVHEFHLKFQIVDDAIPEIAEAFHVVLLKEMLRGDAVLSEPSVVQVTIKPNDKPYGVLSFNSILFEKAVVIDEDTTTRFEEITVVRNGGTHGNVSVNWVLTRNSSDASPVTADITPSSGVLHFAQGQMLASIPLTVVADDFPEEAEAYLLQILPHTILGGAEVSEPAELLFYIQDSDDVYGLITFFPMENQKIESSPNERYLSLSFIRLGGMKGDVKMFYSALYIPAGAVDPLRARDSILIVSRRNSLIFPEQKSQVTAKLPIRNDAFLQNGAHFLVQLETLELLNIIPPIPSISPRFGKIQNVSLEITPDIANGEIGFISNLPVILHEPEDSDTYVVCIPLHRDGTDGQAAVYWSLRASGFNSKAVTLDDIGPFNGSVVFVSGQSDTMINITVKADDIPEMNETVTLSLDRVNVENQVLKSGYTSRDLLILENDDPGGIFEFSPASRGPYVIKEGESVELHIIRSKGALVKQFLHYRVEPRDSNEFYGNTGVLEFKPGEREIVITLLTRLDGIPELDEHYSVVLSSHGEWESKLGSATVVNITILKNDEPHGIVEFVSDDLSVTINESKGDYIYSAVYRIIRNRGSFGNVSVSWIVTPDFTQDVVPVQGIIFFGDQEFSKNITIISLPDEIPEEMEEFTITLLNATGGAKLGNGTTATLRIERNDDPIYFAEPRVLRVQEGETAGFRVLRNGSLDVSCAVMLATVDGTASAREGDFIPIEKGEILIFAVGSREQNITIIVNEDDIPETDELFYVTLFNSTGNTVVFQHGVATVIIEANDDPNGIFSLEPIDKAVEEGKTNVFWVLRHRGHFGNVSVAWQLLQNDTALHSGQEFYETSGTVDFMDGEETKPIILRAYPDRIPEFNEFYILKLVNISGGSPGPGGQLAGVNLQVTVMIPFNDDPFGIFSLEPGCLEREVAEDVFSEDDMSYITNFTILRQQGVFGDVRVGWEVLSSEFTTGLPPMIDYLLVGVFPNTVHLQPHMRRHHSGTDALYFSGLEGAFGTVNPKYHPSRNNSIANFTFSAWVMPNANTDGFVVAKDDGNGGIYYGVKVQTNETHVTLALHYKTLGSNATYIAKTTVMKYLEENVWLHLLIILDDGIIEFYLDGSAVPRGIRSLKGEAITDGPGILRIGAGINGNSRFTGLMQDVRSYGRKLSLEEIYELHAMPAKNDLYPVSGYLEFRQGETNKSFIISARDDNEEEGEELFILKLVSVYGGARISGENAIAKLRIQKSDNANGLFGFTGTCIPEIAEEGSTISCVVERTRGALDYVHVFYTISQIESDGINYLVDDFANASGSITFFPWQRSEVLNIYVLDDDIPELNQYFRVTLVSAISGDGKLGSTPTSGASIDPEKETTDITVKASDHPYGLLQFSTGLPPLPDDKMVPPASSIPHVTVQEEDGEVKLLVTRAQGLLGRVMVEFRTVPLTAVSPDDYQNVAGTLEFQHGDRYKYISVNITDNSVPELEKSFKVELFNSEGGVTGLFRVEGSGSGDGDMEFFLPAIHKRASLGVASQILVTIVASDHAHGVFEFSPESLFVTGTEPEDGSSIVTLNSDLKIQKIPQEGKGAVTQVLFYEEIMRSHGALSQVTLVWSIESDPDGDLAFTSGNVTFEIGQKSANITVEILPDEQPELDKVFSVSILSVSSGSLGNHTNATLVVLASDDPYGVFIFSEKNRPIQVEEATQNITLSIIRLKGLMGKVMVTYATLGDMEKPSYFPPNLARATQGRDCIPASGFALFGPNQSEATITVSILDDDEPERSESLFIELLNSTLIEDGQGRPILNSPRLGPNVETIAHLIIIANDDAFGVLQLSAPVVRVAENHVGPIINVTRTGGAFADVSVKFKAVPITAIAGEDYSIASSDVVLLEGETSKAVPIYIINDIYPELEETFLVKLLNETTGGAKLGASEEAIIIIEASDDPYGLFGFQLTKFIVEEPEFSSVKVNLAIIRNSGTLGNVTVQWVATINGQLAAGDLRVVSGNVTFAPGETIQTLLLEVLADDVPETEEVIQVQLTDASGGGTIGVDGVANIVIPANDNPYGTVAFVQSVYRVQEPLERSSCANITVRRSGGHFGRLLLFYGTSDIDVVALAVEGGQDLLSFYESPIQGVPDPLQRTWVNVSAMREPQNTCAALCLKEPACSAFSIFSAPEGPQCFWMTSWISPTVNDSGFWTYRKNTTRVVSLFSSQAVAGSDYEPVTRQWAIMQEGEGFVNLTVSVLPDNLPEMDESFQISLLEVHLMNVTVSVNNQPTIGEPNASTVVIALNGDAYGVFVIYSISPNTSEDGLYVEVQEQPQSTVELMIHRTGGSLGQVTVEWRVVGGTAIEGLDFVGAGDILTFAEGETKKIAILTILDDSEPEDDESIVVGLVCTEGGSRVSPNSDTVRVNILANDNVAGIVSFQTSSRSIIGHEGEILQFHVIRTPPGRGNVTVNWKILGKNLELSFANFTGQLFFPEGSLNETVFVHLLDDNIPEEKEVYQVILHDIRTQGVPPAGIALLDAQGYAAVLTVEASDEPHGVLNFALSSRFVLLQEANTTIQLFINREFGSLGTINVTYTTLPGMLSAKNLTEGNMAEPDADFVSVVGSLILGDGETSAAINISILEDDIPELEEYFFVNLTSVELIMAPLTSFPPRLDSEGLTAQIIIDANDGARGIVEWQQSRFEVNETQGSLTLVAQRSRGALGLVSLFVYAQNLEAQVELDYVFTPMILHFADGERHKSVDIIIFDDDIPEGDEKFQLILAYPSPGLELGENTIALITILANDDGPGVLSFNNSEHFFLREPTAVYVQESVAVLSVVREPAQGLFGTVTVQFIVTEVNSSKESSDLTPSKGYIILEEGVQFKALHISAVLDTEPEMDEHFVCTLFNPTGGARLGAQVQTLITVLQNQAPLGLFSISAVANRDTSIDVEETNRTIYLNVSRTNGIDLAVSVQWDTISETAFGMRGTDVVFSIVQSFFDVSASGWCFFTWEDSVYGVMLRKLSSTLYRWQGVFTPIQDLNIENPKTCEAFNIGFSPYFVITHKGRNEEKPSANSVYTFTSGLKLFLVQTIIVSESSQVRYFTADGQDYLIVGSQRKGSALSQVFRWNGGSFVFHQLLPAQGVLSMALFPRGGSVFLLTVQESAHPNSLLLRWSGSEFINFQEIPVNATTQVEALTSGDDTYLIFARAVFLDHSSVDIFIWERGQSSFRYFQSMDFATVNKIHTFTPASGIVHVLLVGQAMSALYGWDSELNRFSFILEAPSAHDVASVTVKCLNSSKNLIALMGDTHSHLYELAYISSLSDFIPSSGELIFEPGDREAVIAINILDDTVPEEEESFRIQLKNPKGGAEIGNNGYVKVTILANDDAYGVIGFAQNSLYKEVEEMDQDSLVTLNVERLKGTYGRITIIWEADGNIGDIFPTSGVISFSEGQALSTITLTVLADDIPEFSETVVITLMHINTEGIEELSKGATVDQKRNKSVIAILSNDAPYGLVGWLDESLFLRTTEPEENVTILQLQIVRDKGLTGDIAIHLIAKSNFLLHVNNQATENEDFILQDKIIIMKENMKRTHANIAILPDDVPELDEGFIVNITEVYLLSSDFSVGQPNVLRPGMEIAEIMIDENDDPRGVFKFHVIRDVDGVITACELPAPLNLLQISVVRLAGNFGTVNISWRATADSADFEDFKPSHGILEFAEGQDTAVIEITIIDDAKFELMETFNISLVGVIGGGRLGDDVVLTVGIPQNDSPFGIFGFEEKTVTIDESLFSNDPDAYVTLTVVRSPGGKGAVRLHWALDKRAKDNLRPLNGTLHFDETESQKTIVLHTLQDTVLEKDRNFTIQLMSVDEVEISPVKGSASIIIRGDKGAFGEVGIAPSSRHILIGEPSAQYNGTAIISLVRGPAIWGEVTVFWRIFPSSVGQFAETSGNLTMQDGQSAAVVVVQALDDDIPEEKHFYEFQLTGISEGAVLSEFSNTANITVVASDFPYGQFAFSQEQLQVSEEARRANITVIRSGGSFGRVKLWYNTLSETAEAGLDFVPGPGELVFEEKEIVKNFHVEILDDGLPEGPEDFYLVLTKVKLLGRGYDFMIQENGLQVDQPPEIGNISTVRIIIMRNDNAEGIIEFDSRYTAFEVEEDVGMIMIPVLRLHGTYGLVTADFISQSSSAVPGGVDYVLHGSSVTFQHGQNLSYINVSIVDDDESEFAEPIEVVLVGAAGGAILGRHLVSRITIAKSDSPSGVVRFLNQSRISVPNPNSTMTISLVLERTGGLLGETQVNWEIEGPNSQEVLPPHNRDIADPVSGSFYFGEGEGGVRTIVLTIYAHEEVEVEETFIIKLHLVKGEAKLDPRAKDVKLIVQKFGDPNGVVQFAPDSLSQKTYLEPSALEGPLIIIFSVQRVKGIFGEITVYWELSSEFDITGDFLSTKGFFTFSDGESEASFDVHLLPDDTPEIEEDYMIQLTSVDGGAELDPEKCITSFSVSANDDPHGVFALYSDNQSILIAQNLSRSIQINVTRHAGTFGDVAVGFLISSNQKDQLSTTENAERQLVVKDGVRYKVEMVPIPSQVFLSLGSNFTLQLVAVMLVGGRIYGMPKILQEAKFAVVPVPEEASNSQVGFESPAFPLMDIAAGTSHIVISRRGTYGPLWVAWAAGYAPGFEVPEFIIVGNMTPKQGNLSFSHGEQSKGVLVWTLPRPGQPEAFPVHLLGVQSSAPGGAQLRSGFTIAEIEPMGVFQFSPSSRNIIVSEDTQTVRLQVQRLFGFHGDLIKVSYQTTAGSAKPLEDFEPVQKKELLFQNLEAEVDFEIMITNDQLPEIKETFYINLTSVEMKESPKLDAIWRPRLNPDFSVAEITILDDDDLEAVDVFFPKTTQVALTMGTALIPVETDSSTIYPDTTKITSIPQPTEIIAIITEATSMSVIPEKLVTFPGTPTISEKPDEVAVTTNISIHGTFSLGPPIVYVKEEMKNGTLNVAEVLIRRTGGCIGNVSVTLKTFGGRSAQKEPNALPFPDTYGMSNLTWAIEEDDFEEQTLLLTFVDGEREHKALIQILDDDEPEGQEFFYVFLTDPQGGAQIVMGTDDMGFSALAMIIITGSDLHNGIIGFSEESQEELALGEGAGLSTLYLTVTRQPDRAFEDVTVFWRVTFNKSATLLEKAGMNLMDTLFTVSGTTTCVMGQTKCLIPMGLKQGKIPQVEIKFFVELYEVTDGAAINNSARFAQIKVLQKDESQSLVYFSVGSRLPVTHKEATLISLQVVRHSGTGLMISVSFSTQELRSAETVGRTLISPAISGKDFVKSEGTLVFEPGQRNTVLDVILTPDIGSLNPFPKRFQIMLFDPKGAAKVDKVYGTANVTLVSDADSQAIWGLADQLQQPLNSDILNHVLHSISRKVATESTDEQLSAVMHLIDKITLEGKSQVFSSESRNLFYEILCVLINPKRKDTKGFSHFSEVTENFAFSLLTDVTCGSPGEKSKTIFDSCPYLSIMAFHWYPQQINGHKFEGKEGDYIRIPERLLVVPDAELMTGKSKCELVQFIEYSSHQWFITGNKLPALRNKVLSLNVKGQSSKPLSDHNEVLYRIYAAESRIVPQTSQCLLWNRATASWLSDSQFCKVVEDTSDYVECACSYMSMYAVYAQTDNLTAYNEAFFSSGFICTSGLCLAVLSHVFCARYSMFAAKLLTHMMAASLGTQVVFLATAYASPQLTNGSCSVMAAVTHYLYLCQFSWMLIQSVNFWYVLVMNDEHTERRYLLFFLLSWGLPALVVTLLIVILKGIYHQDMSQIYGLIHGDLCFIPNIYAALFTAALLPLMCLVVVFVVFIHAYQVKPQWKAYDDVFRGRTNATEIPLVLYLFALISMTWLWGGLHMAYRYFWMLILYVIFNSLQGIYVFVVYFILHNQTCCPLKATYTVEMNGHPGPSTTFFTQGSGMPPAGEEISKSTQNLISAMEEVPPDWERASLQQASQASPDLKPSSQNGTQFPSSGGYGQGSLVADEESQEFDDLIFALKTGAGLSVSDNESGQGSQEGGTLTDSQIVELRRIPIADTHL